MSRFYASSRTKVSAVVVLALAGLAGAAHWLDLPNELTAQSRNTQSRDARDGAPPAPAVARDHANALSEAFRNSANQVLPAVVSIRREAETRTVQRELRRPRGSRPGLPPELRDLDPLLRRFFEDLPDMEQFEAPRQPQQSAGSGVIIDPQGVVLTNNHVVAGGGKITVRVHDGREYVAEEVLTDPSTDLAVIRIKPRGELPSAKLGNSDELQVGDWVVAIGQPFGLRNTVTAGIVSATDRAVGIIPTRNGVRAHEEFIQTDAAINPGNSGGPLVNLHGEVVGINTAISSSNGMFQGVGFAVPVNVAKWVSSQLLKDGKVHRAYLGVGIQPIDQDLADHLGMQVPAGALVTEVRPDSPAAAAGIKPQDVIVEFAGAQIRSPQTLSALAGRSPIGSKQPIVVLRDGERMSLEVTVREQPENYGVQQLRSQEPEVSGEEEDRGTRYNPLGLEVAPLADDVARQLGVASGGVVITAVEPGSAAERAGLEAGMAVVRVGRQPIRGVDEFEAAVREADLAHGVLLLVRSEAGSRFVVLRAE